MGIGMATGIANFTDLDAFGAEARRAHAMGLTGAMCIHPNQVGVLNDSFGHERGGDRGGAGHTGGVGAPR